MIVESWLELCKILQMMANALEHILAHIRNGAVLVFNFEKTDDKEVDELQPAEV